MKKHFVRILMALALFLLFFGCGGDDVDELPCITCDGDPYETSGGNSDSNGEVIWNLEVSSASDFAYSSSSLVKCDGSEYNDSYYGCCVNETFNLSTQRCSGSIVETKCGRGWYDASNSDLRCQDGVVEMKCGIKWYNSENQRCENNVVETKCGSEWYDASNSNLLCDRDISDGTYIWVVFAKCGNRWYRAFDSNLRCQSNVVEAKCGNEWYDTYNFRCQNNVIETMCGNYWYNANNSDFRCECASWLDFGTTDSQCISKVVETKCGSGWYDASNPNSRCQNNVAEMKCGSSWYDASNFRCQNGEIQEAKCGNVWYNVKNSNLRCQNSVVETKCGSEWYDASNSNFNCYMEQYLSVKCGDSWYSVYNSDFLCQSNVAECGGKLYDTSNSNFRCQSNVLEAKCGSNWYDVLNFGSYCQISYENEIYNAVLIGKQVWMAKNLNYNVIGSKCPYNLESNCERDGRLYDWATAMALGSSCNSNSCDSQIGTKHKGICPNGWHIPSTADWSALRQFIESDKGCTNCCNSYLQTTSGWSYDANGTNDYGSPRLS